MFVKKRWEFRFTAEDMTITFVTVLEQSVVPTIHDFKELRRFALRWPLLSTDGWNNGREDNYVRFLLLLARQKNTIYKMLKLVCNGY